MQRFFMRTMKAVIRVCGCAGSLESLLGAHIRRYVFSRCASYYLGFLTLCMLGKSSADYSLMFFFFFSIKYDLTFRATFSIGDSLHEMSNPVFWEENKNNNI